AMDQQNISSIGYCQLINNQVVNRLERPIIFPEYSYERKGTEDPRITLLDGTYYLFYTAHDGDGDRDAVLNLLEEIDANRAS
ncbi:hypothetical protein KKA08_05250, partial [bacterium]|nr:hypothetical protein [bacterium]